MSSITEHIIAVKAEQTLLPGSSNNSDVPPHAGNHQKGGSDEMDLAGMIGELNDPQKAGYIFDAAIDIAGLSDGYVLKYVLATDTWEPGPDSAVISLQDAYETGNTIVTDVAHGALTILGTEALSFSGSTLAFSATANMILGSTGGDLILSDQNLAPSVKLSGSGTTALDTVAQEIIDAINENFAAVTDVDNFHGFDIEEPDATRDKLGPQLIVDPFMTAATTAAYAATNSATLSRVTNGEGGQCTRAAYNGVANFGLQQIVMTVGVPCQVIARIRSDSSRTIRIRWFSASDYVVLKTVGTDWVYFYGVGTPTGANLVVELIDSAGYMEVDWILANNVRADIPVTGDKYRRAWLQNLFTYSGSIENVDWAGGRFTRSDSSGLLSPVVDRDTGLQTEYTSLVGTALLGAHYIQQTAVVVANQPYTIRSFLKEGDKTWCYIRNQTDGNNVHINLADLEVGTTSADDVALIKHPNGVEVLTQFTPSTTALQLQIYAAIDNTTSNYTGDDVTVDLFLTGMQIYKGTIADNFPYVKTTTAAETGQHDFLLETETIQEYRERLGLMERLVNGAPSGIFETQQEDYVYIAPPSKQHLGNGSKVYCQIIDSSGHTGTVTANVAGGVVATKAVLIEGAAQDLGGTQWLQLGWYSSSSYFARGKIDTGAQTLEIERGSAMNTGTDAVTAKFYFTID